MGDVRDGPVIENLYQAQSGPVMSALLAACPSFKDAWRSHQADMADWDGSHEYLDVAAFADHMAVKLKAGETDEFPAVFAAAERLLRENHRGREVWDVIGVGLFEDMQGSAHILGGFWLSSRFRPWLGPESVKLWDAVSKSRYGTTDEPSVLAARAVEAHLKLQRRAVVGTVILGTLLGISILWALGQTHP